MDQLDADEELNNPVIIAANQPVNDRCANRKTDTGDETTVEIVPSSDPHCRGPRFVGLDDDSANPYFRAVEHKELDMENDPHEPNTHQIKPAAMSHPPDFDAIKQKKVRQQAMKGCEDFVRRFNEAADMPVSTGMDPKDCATAICYGRSPGTKFYGKWKTLNTRQLRWNNPLNKESINEGKAILIAFLQRIGYLVIDFGGTFRWRKFKGLLKDDETYDRWKDIASCTISNYETTKENCKGKLVCKRCLDKCEHMTCFGEQKDFLDDSEDSDYDETTAALFPLRSGRSGLSESAILFLGWI